MCKEVASSKTNEFKTRVQKSVPYLLPQWRQNGYNRYPIYDQSGWKSISFWAAHTYIAHIRSTPRELVVQCDRPVSSVIGKGRMIMKRTVVGDCNWRFAKLRESHRQSQVVIGSHPDDHTGNQLISPYLRVGVVPAKIWLPRVYSISVTEAYVLTYLLFGWLRDRCASGRDEANSLFWIPERASGAIWA